MKDKSAMMQTKNFLENTRLVSGISMLTIALSVGYYFTIAQPRVQREKFELEKKEFETKQAKIEQGEKDFKNCAMIAEINYTDNWKLRCKQAKKPENCTSLPGYLSADLNKSWEEAKLNCAKLYK